MKIASWNVNSLGMRLARLVDWLAAQRPDIVCLQETKIEDDKFPVEPIAAAGYQSFYAGQKTYNGVAILVRSGIDVADVVAGVDDFVDEQKRLLAATIAGMRIVCAYVPHGQVVDSDKYRYKLAWCEALAAHLKNALAQYPWLIVAGDLNVAPDDRDVHDPELWSGQIMCSEGERAAFRAFLATGLVDSFRLFEQPPKTFSWWDYRQLAFPKNAGLRIDHILLSTPLTGRCMSSRIDREARKGQKPSDHAPVSIELRDA